MQHLLITRVSSLMQMNQEGFNANLQLLGIGSQWMDHLDSRQSQTDTTYTFPLHAHGLTVHLLSV